MQTITLATLAELLGATYHGDPHCVITGIATLQNAKAGEITFLSNPAYRKFLKDTQASAVIVTAEDVSHCNTASIVVVNPYLAYAKVATLLAPQLPQPTGVHSTAVIGNNCSIHPSASIGAYTVLGDNVVIAEHVVIGSHCNIGHNCHIQAHTTLWANVTLYYGVNIGCHSILHSGVVIGSDGFGMAKDGEQWVKIPQIGSVIVGNNVEIGANTSIDRGALEDTIIEDGVKLDNQIQIGHNVTIGANTAIAGCVAIAGSTKIGRNCAIGGGACIGGHISICDNVMITGMAGIHKSLTTPGVYSSGIPATDNRTWARNALRFHTLEDLTRKIHKLEKQLKKLYQLEGSET